MSPATSATTSANRRFLAIACSVNRGFSNLPLKVSSETMGFGSSNRKLAASRYRASGFVQSTIIATRECVGATLGVVYARAQSCDLWVANMRETQWEYYSLTAWVVA